MYPVVINLKNEIIGQKLEHQCKSHFNLCPAAILKSTIKFNVLRFYGIFLLFHKMYIADFRGGYVSNILQYINQLLVNYRDIIFSLLKILVKTDQTVIKIF